MADLGASQWIGRLPAVLTATNVIGLFGVWVIYRLGLALYNISPYHPLHRFPGPKFAAATFLYEFWFDFVKGGRYTWEIKRMHEKYGPIVRINPEELHCNDPDFADEIYAGGNRVRDKQQHHVNSVAGPVSMSTFATVEHETHRTRRNAASRFFSRAQMLRFENEINTITTQLCDKLLAWKDKPAFDINDAFACFTADAISQYAYGEPTGYLTQPNWTPNFRDSVRALGGSCFVLRFMPVFRNLVDFAPHFAKYMTDEIAMFMNETAVVLPRRIQEVKDNSSKGRMFAELLESNLPESEKSVYRLSGEAFSLIGAGTETTAKVLSNIVYYVRSNSEIQTRLVTELKNANVDPVNLSWTALEKIPYLYGIVYEGLRLSHGTSARSPRIAREEDLVYKNANGDQYVVPRGTPIGMSAFLANTNEDIFPEAMKFAPERWIDEQGGKNHGLERHMFSFSKGSRQCMGMNLALCELYLVTAAISLRVFPHMELFNVTEEDVIYDFDMVVPHPKVGTNGIRVVIS